MPYSCKIDMSFLGATCLLPIISTCPASTCTPMTFGPLSITGWYCSGNSKISSLAMHLPSSFFSRHVFFSLVTTFRCLSTDASIGFGSVIKFDDEVISNQLSPVISQQMPGTTPKLNQCKDRSPQYFAASMPAKGADTVIKSSFRSLDVLNIVSSESSALRAINPPMLCPRIDIFWLFVTLASWARETASFSALSARLSLSS